MLILLEDADNGIRELYVKRWSQKVNNMEDWTSAVKEGTVLIHLWVILRGFQYLDYVTSNGGQIEE
jgi:hypothetical protein